MTRKLFGFWLVIAAIAFCSVNSLACVGRTLYVGALNSAEEKVMAEMLVLLINERTGTTVKIRFFDDRDQLYKALQSEEEEARADIIVEDSGDAMAMLNQPRLNDLDQEYTTGKELYDKQFNIVWLNPFGFTNLREVNGGAVSAPLVRRDVLANFPLLPRVLNKLAGAIDNETFLRLLSQVKSGDKPKNVAKDFLTARKFI